VTRIWDVEDTVVWACAPIMEILGNAANYHVASGCAASYSGANLNVTIAAGLVAHDGTSVTVAGNVVTLVADGSNPRWSWVSINSSGTAVLTSGTPAADPTIPSYGDTVPICLVKVTAGATVASSLASRYDQRYFPPTASADTEDSILDANVTTTSTTLADITGLTSAVAANTTYMFKAIVHYFSPATNDYKFGITCPAGAVLRADIEYQNTSAVGTIGAITASGGSIAANGLGAAIPGILVITGSLSGTYSAGTLAMQHALNGGAGTNTTLAKSQLEVF
jgi:hypothetical protein